MFVVRASRNEINQRHQDKLKLMPAINTVCANVGEDEISVDFLRFFREFAAYQLRN